MSDVRINLNGKLSRFNRLVSGASLRVIGEVFQSWSKIFGAFIRTRFVRASRGDGTWPPLSPGTIRRRRKGKGSGSPSILRDTGLLFSHVVPTFQGLAVQDHAPKFEATISFGGDATYPDGYTTSEIASFHQTGGGNLPQRKIIVPPDVKTKDQMAKVAKTIIAKHTNG